VDKRFLAGKNISKIQKALKKSSKKFIHPSASKYLQLTINIILLK